MRDSEGKMFFHTYTTHDIQINDVYEKLFDLLDQYQTNELITNEKLSKMKEALSRSKDNSCASRYGLSEIKFAETEIINAYERVGQEVQYMNYRYDFKDIPMNHKRRDFPLVLAIEASSICNLRCRMCFQQNKEFTGNPDNMGIMEWDTYVHLMNNIKQDQLYSIVFASRGEPLLNKRIPDMIELAKKKGVLDIKMNTNAVLLNEDMSRRLLQAGLDQIVFSVDSSVPEHYKTIRGADFDTVSTNIKNFVRIKNEEFPDSKIKTRISMVINDIYKDNMQQEVELSCEYWNGIIDEVAFKSENDFCGIYEDHDVESQQCCNLLWERMYIWHNGDVNPCDIDHLSKLKVGNVLENSISELWNSVNMEKLRTDHLCSRDKMTCVCKNCVGY